MVRINVGNFYYNFNTINVNKMDGKLRTPCIQSASIESMRADLKDPSRDAVNITCFFFKNGFSR